MSGLDICLCNFFLKPSSLYRDSENTCFINESRGLKQSNLENFMISAVFKPKLQLSFVINVASFECSFKVWSNKGPQRGKHCISKLTFTAIICFYWNDVQLSVTQLLKFSLLWSERKNHCQFSQEQRKLKKKLLPVGKSFMSFLKSKQKTTKKKMKALLKIYSLDFTSWGHLVIFF